jgi:hypothetical protein
LHRFKKGTCKDRLKFLSGKGQRFEELLTAGVFGDFLTAECAEEIARREHKGGVWINALSGSVSPNGSEVFSLCSPSPLQSSYLCALCVTFAHPAVKPFEVIYLIFIFVLNLNQTMKVFLFLLLLLPALGQAQIKAIDEVSRSAAKEKLEGIRLRVIKGESMASLAEQYSEDPGSAKNGGLYVNIPRGQMVPEFEAVAFSLQPGQISDVFETQYGFHFIQLVSKHDEMVDVRHILVVPK